MFGHKMMLLLMGVLLLVAVSAEAGVPADIYVARDGNDAAAGTKAAPLATLEGARDRIRVMKREGKLPEGGITVWIGGGRYELSRPLELTAEDSGTAAAPITYRATAGAEVRVIGGKVVRGFQPVTDPAVLKRLDPAARGHVLQADLKAQGITDYGAAGGKWEEKTDRPEGGGLELFFQDQPMTLARWPNDGFIKITKEVGGREPGAISSQVGEIGYEGNRPKRWTAEKDIWCEGFWCQDWCDERKPVESIDTENHIITLKPPPHFYGYQEGMYFYAYNLLVELDSPGEWYLDRETGVLYFWPPAGLRESDAAVSVLPALVRMQDTSHVTLRGLILEGARGDAVIVTGGTEDRVAGCTIRNVGSYAVVIRGGARDGVIGCDISNTGDGGVILQGGDVPTLTPAGHYVENCHIHHYSRWDPMYQPAVALFGVGNRVSHSLIDHAPHMAIFFRGNDHVIEYNRIHDVVQQSNDAGAVYAGQDWTSRGNVIRYNFLYNIAGMDGRGAKGIYLDDMQCGTEVYGNILALMPRSLAVLVGGGRDNIIDNNVLSGCGRPILVDNRMMGWAAGSLPGFTEGLQRLPYQQPPWSTRYPGLVNILDDQPQAPKGNVVTHNVCDGSAAVSLGDPGVMTPMIRMENNLAGQDPHFVDAAHLNYQLEDDSPAWKLGFERIPTEKIGLYQDELRASWPVADPYVPLPPPPAREED